MPCGLAWLLAIFLDQHIVELSKAMCLLAHECPDESLERRCDLNLGLLFAGAIDQSWLDPMIRLTLLDTPLSPRLQPFARPPLVSLPDQDLNRPECPQVFFDSRAQSVEWCHSILC